MTRKKKNNKNKVFLLAFDINNQIVEEVTLSYDEYYEDSSKLIDSEEYRSNKGIIRIEGQIFGYTGELEQDFKIRYSPSGKLIGGKAVHSDGTVIED